MATINYSFVPQTGYTGNYTVKAFKKSAPTVVVTSVVRTPVYTNPVTGTLTVPTYEPHTVAVYGCDAKKVLEFDVIPPSASCPFPGEPVITDITETTATATWEEAPVPPAEGYNWRLLKNEGGVLSLVNSGNTDNLTVPITGMVAGGVYRFEIEGQCAEDSLSLPKGTDFDADAPALVLGTVTLISNKASGGTVVVRSLTNLNSYTCIATTFTNNISIPYDDYEIISYSFNEPCSSSSISPVLHSTFTLSAGHTNQNINIACTGLICYNYRVTGQSGGGVYQYEDCDGVIHPDIEIEETEEHNVCAREGTVGGTGIGYETTGFCPEP